MQGAPKTVVPRREKGTFGSLVLATLARALSDGTLDKSEVTRHFFEASKYYNEGNIISEIKCQHFSATLPSVDRFQPFL